MARKAKAKVKLKSKRGAAKRFIKKASGIKFRRCGRAHILTKMSQKRKRQLNAAGRLGPSDVKSVERSLHGS